MRSRRRLRALVTDRAMIGGRAMIDVPSSTEVLENMLQQLSPQAYGRLMQTWQQDQSDPKDVGHRVWIAGRNGVRCVSLTDYRRWRAAPPPTDRPPVATERL